MTDETNPPQDVAGITLCAGVDVMQDRLEVAVRAFGPGAQLLAFHHRAIICGDPAQDQVWQMLWALLQAPVRYPGAGLLGITAVGIDSGGHHTQQVYRFVHQHDQSAPAATPRLLALKGMAARDSAGSLRSMMVDACIAGKLFKNCIELLLVGVKNDRTGLDLADYAQAVYAFVVEQHLTAEERARNAADSCYGPRALEAARAWLLEAETRVQVLRAAQMTGRLETLT